MEVTSYQSAMLLAFQRECPGLGTDLLYPRSEGWMTLEIVGYQAIHFSRLARARAIHLHPTQLSIKVIAGLKDYGIEIHSWDANDEGSLETITKFGITRACTDDIERVFRYREKL